MTTYNIERWDVILYKTNNYYPIIYFKPDEDLIKFFKANDNTVIANISNSKSLYDNKQIPGIINTLEYDRPNLFNETGYYTITLYTDWLGYPMYGNNGEVSFSGFVIPKEIEQQNNLNNSKNIQNKDIQNKSIKLEFKYVLIILLILIIVLLFNKK